MPLGFTPHRHQEQAFERLGGRGKLSTLIATGTGSGKTESFLLPILDHCLLGGARHHLLEIDPGEDYIRVNARLVAEYASEDRVEILAELDKAAGELAAFLRSLSEEQWRGGTGVLAEGEEMTIRQNVDWLIEDHHHHAEQIHDLARLRLKQ